MTNATNLVMGYYPGFVLNNAAYISSLGIISWQFQFYSVLFGILAFSKAADCNELRLLHTMSHQNILWANKDLEQETALCKYELYEGIATCTNDQCRTYGATFIFRLSMRHDKLL